MQEHIHHSNLIENVDDPFEDKLSGLAWKYISAQKRLTYERVMELHRLITINQLDIDTSGEPRRVPVYIATRFGNVQTPPPMEAFMLFKQWLHDMQSWRKLDPKEMHIRLEKIHPWVDGNGRTGRMLMWWHESMLNREPTIIRFENRKDYYKWFKTAADIKREEQYWDNIYIEMFKRREERFDV